MTFPAIGRQNPSFLSARCMRFHPSHKNCAFHAETGRPGRAGPTITARTERIRKHPLGLSTCGQAVMYGVRDL